jgi:hypothetical protein
VPTKRARRPPDRNDPNSASHSHIISSCPLPKSLNDFATSSFVKSLMLQTVRRPIRSEESHMLIDLASSVFGVIGIVVFSVWFLLTFAFQKNNRLSRITTRFDRFTLIPKWSFFTPDPGASNYHFVYRSRDKETSFSPWLELNLSPRGILFPLWNPRKRYRESMIELFQLLALSSINFSADRLQFTAPYIILLGVARKHLGGSLSSQAAYQFALVETRGPSGASVPLVRFYSLTHPVS